MSYKEIKWNPEKTSDLKQIMNKNNCNQIKYPSKIDDWKKIERNNPTIVLNVLYIKRKRNMSCLYFKI